MIRTFAIAAALAACACADTSPEAKARQALDNASVMTTLLCEEAMEAQLKSPATADYPFGHSTAVEALDASRYRLASYVDSENAFGATVRTNFACIVEGSGEERAGYKVAEFAAVPR